jgi:hypothetical protein
MCSVNEDHLCYSGVFDEVGALLARRLCSVERSSSGLTNTCLEYGVVLGMDGMAGIGVIVTASRYLSVGKSSSRAASAVAVNLARSHAVISITDHLLVLDQYGPDFPSRTS